MLFAIRIGDGIDGMPKRVSDHSCVMIRLCLEQFLSTVQIREYCFSGLAPTDHGTLNGRSFTIVTTSIKPFHQPAARIRNVAKVSWLGRQGIPYRITPQQ